jgi:hypothetical protein
MQGIFINGQRPKSKAEIKRALAADPSSVRVEATSMFGNEYDGPASELPATIKPILFVGPDPYSKRNYYGKLQYGANGKLTVI